MDQAPPRPIAWVNALFLTLTPILAFAGTAWHVSTSGVHWIEPALFAFFYTVTGMSITGGYHRLYAHRSYSCRPVIEWLYLLFGAACFQNSALRWARDHRLHHRKVDTDEDPYSIKKGAFFAHMGWIYFQDPRDLDFSHVPDLTANPRVRWQHRWYVPLAFAAGFLLPAAIGGLFGRALGGFLWGGLLRMVIVHHLTFLINSAAHLVGSQRYSLRNTARDSGLIAVLTYGEGYHNFHHRFPSDYRNGHRWYHFDPGKWMINAFRRIGVVDRVSRHRDQHILQARLEVDFALARRRIEHLPAQTVTAIERRLQEARAALESASVQLHQLRDRYREAKASALADSRRRAHEWKLAIERCERDFSAAWASWREMTDEAWLIHVAPALG